MFLLFLTHNLVWILSFALLSSNICFSYMKVLAKTILPSFTHGVLYVQASYTDNSGNVVYPEAVRIRIPHVAGVPLLV